MIMNRTKHYIVSAYREYMQGMVSSIINFVIILFLFLLYMELSLWKVPWFIFFIWLVAFAYILFVFFRNLWKKRHLKDHVYIDCGPEGICVDVWPSVKYRRSVFYGWRDIEFMNYYVHRRGGGEFMLRIKPYKKRPKVYEFSSLSFSNPYGGLPKAIKEFSGRKDIIKRRYSTIVR